MYRVRTLLTGASMVDGVCTMHFLGESSPTTTGAQKATDAAYAFWQGAKDLLLSQMSIKSAGTVEWINPTTGALENELAVTPAASFTGTNASAGYAAGVGCRVKWFTNGYVRGRRVVGSTFLVPVATGHYDNDGTLKATAVTIGNAAAAALLAADDAAIAKFVVWSRNNDDKGYTGSAHDVISGSVADASAWLRTRRT